MQTSDRPQRRRESPSNAELALLRIVDAGLIVATRRRGWTYYRRNEPAIASATARITRI